MIGPSNEAHTKSPRLATVMLYKYMYVSPYHDFSARIPPNIIALYKNLAAQTNTTTQKAAVKVSHRRPPRSWDDNMPCHSNKVDVSTMSYML